MSTENEAYIQKEVSEENSINPYPQSCYFAALSACLRSKEHVLSQALLEERLLHLRTENEACIQKEVNEEIS